MGQVKFSETETAEAMMEYADDGVKEAIKHMKDVMTEDEKPCKVTIEITVTPNKARTQFETAVKSKITRSGRPAVKSTIYADLDDNGEVNLAEYRQSGLPFEK